VHGANVHYSTAGLGTTSLIFVHGWTCDESTWMRQVPEVARTYRVVTIDLPGHGQRAVQRRRLLDGAVRRSDRGGARP
jgi:pimeloyl-ACP methyl ester carboxylesterase